MMNCRARFVCYNIVYLIYIVTRLFGHSLHITLIDASSTINNGAMYSKISNLAIQ